MANDIILQSPKKNYIDLLSQVLNELTELAFWQYVRFYGIIPKYYNQDRSQALLRLLNAAYVDESFARKELIRLGWGAKAFS